MVGKQKELPVAVIMPKDRELEEFQETVNKIYAEMVLHYLMEQRIPKELQRKVIDGLTANPDMYRKEADQRMGDQDHLVR